LHITPFIGCISILPIIKAPGPSRRSISIIGRIFISMHENFPKGADIHIMYTANLWGHDLLIETRPGLFSPAAADVGTLAMVSTVELKEGQTLLDLGCGTGLVGIAAAKTLGETNVYMTDIDPNAVACARENAARNGVPNVTISCGDALSAVDFSGFDWILSNPPYHADFSVAKTFIEKGFNRLKVGGRLVMVVKRELWYRNKLTVIFGGVKMAEIDGYYIFTAEKRSASYAPKKQKAPKTPPKSDKKHSHKK